MFGAPVVIAARGTKTARKVAGLIALAGVITTVCALFMRSRIAALIGIGLFFVGFAMFLYMSTLRVICREA